MPYETYTIQRGDSLNKIADSFSVNAAMLASYNDIANPNFIQPGQVLSIPGDTEKATSYTIRRGDTLGKIANRFDYPGGYQALARANNIADPGSVSVGTVLRLDSEAAAPQTGGVEEEQASGGTEQAAQDTSGAEQAAQDTGGAAQEVQSTQDTSSADQKPEESAAPVEESWLAEAVEYNNVRNYSGSKWRQYQGLLKVGADGVPGKNTARGIYRWQGEKKLEQDGQLGPNTLALLLGNGTSAGADSGGAGAEGEGGEVTGLRQKILDIAHSTLSSSTGHHYYSQPGKLTTDPLAASPLRSDCSQWVRAVYLKAGAGDPGTYTGAMVGASKKTKNPTPGDLMLKSGHVELYIGNGKTIGHGSPPINKGTTTYWKGRGMYYATYGFLK